MFELKTISQKADHPLLPMPAAPETTAAREPNQRRLMAVALVLLLVALGLLLYRDRDFWFPDNSEAEDVLDSVPVAANTGTQPSTSKAVAAEKAPEKKFVASKPQPKLPVVVAPAATVIPAPPPATAVRTVLPPLEVEVVAGDNHSTIHPGTTSVHVDLQPRTPPRVIVNPSPVEATAVAPPAATITSNAAERVEMSSRAAEVVGQPVRPSYPMLARQMKVQGSVILQALIGRDGAIQSLHVVSGPPILANAAQEAVRQWRFKPHYEGSDPVETQANITVNFTISTN